MSMSGQVFLGAIFASSAATLAAPPVPPSLDTNAVTEYRVVGESTATVDGGSGQDGMSAACQSDYGPQSRMCTTLEVIRSPEITGLPAGSTGAWVQPIITSQGVVYDPTPIAAFTAWVHDAGGITTRVRDAFPSNAIDRATISCSGWFLGNDSFNGAAYDRSEGRLTIRSCGQPQPVLCCAPHTD